MNRFLLARAPALNAALVRRSARAVLRRRSTATATPRSVIARATRRTSASLSRVASVRPPPAFDPATSSDRDRGPRPASSR
jgi:hypothetical protein